MEIHESWMNHGWKSMCHGGKNLKRAVPIAKTAFEKDGYGPIFDHSPLLELKQNEARSTMSDTQFN